MLNNFFVFSGCAAYEPCPVDYCLNRGVCVDLWTSKHCECRPGYENGRCEIQAMAHFQENSFLHFAVVSGEAINSLAFEFTTNGSIGILFYTVRSEMRNENFCMEVVMLMTQL